MTSTAPTPPTVRVGAELLMVSAVHRDNPAEYAARFTACPRRRAHRRQARGGPRVPAALLGALVRARFRADQGGPGPPGLGLRPARCVHRVGQLVPRGIGYRHQVPVRDGATAGDRLAAPTTVLWPEFDPLITAIGDWSDRLGEFFSQVRLRYVDGAGHFAPLEYPDVLAEEILAAVAAPNRV